MRAAVTGVTGYVGGRLVPELLRAGFEVRALARHPERLAGREWADDVELVEADASDLDQIRAALQGADVAYYLVHSLGTGRTFEVRDRRTALTFARAGREAGVGRIVYLGGLFPDVPEGELSPHLASRKEVGEILLASGVPTTVLRAAVILGSGSASFEMMRYLTERLPAMTTPKWVDNRIQPIAVRDVLHYLLGAARVDPDLNRAVDIGGPDVLRYGQMMNGYALEAGLRQRAIAALPVLTPGLASHWVNLVTPVPRAIARPLIASLQNECVMDDHDIDAIIPQPEDGLTSYRTSVRLALHRMDADEVETSWQDADVLGAPSDPLPSDPEWAGRTVFTDERSAETSASPERLWEVIAGIGGTNGWYSARALWEIRGWMDRLVGGIGLARGRRSRGKVRVGDAIDFWRVEAVEDGRLLRLRAEMRVPGEAWLELKVAPREGGP